MCVVFWCFVRVWWMYLCVCGVIWVGWWCVWGFWVFCACRRVRRRSLSWALGGRDVKVCDWFVNVLYSWVLCMIWEVFICFVREFFLVNWMVIMVVFINDGRVRGRFRAATRRRRRFVGFWVVFLLVFVLVFCCWMCLLL